MGRMYERPEMRGQMFVADEYVASCKEEPASYLFVCDKPAAKNYSDVLYYYDDRGNKHRLGGYAPCGETHEAPVTDVFRKGFIDWNDNRKEDADEGCYVWIEYFWGAAVDWHATSNMDPNSWEKNVS